MGCRWCELRAEGQGTDLNVGTISIEVASKAETPDKATMEEQSLVQRGGLRSLLRSLLTRSEEEKAAKST